MRVSMLFREFAAAVGDHANAPLSMQLLAHPFGLSGSAAPSETLLLGHILDDLASRYGPEDALDCFDVASAAYDLGLDEAGSFLDDAPELIMRRVTEHSLH